MAAIPSSTWAGVLGMTRTTGVPAGSCGLDRGGVDARGQRDDEGARAERGARSRPAGRAMSWGLTTRTTVSRLGGRLGVLEHRDAVARAQLQLALRAAVGGDDPVGRPAGPEQAGQHGLPHHARAQDGEPQPATGHLDAVVERPLAVTSSGLVRRRAARRRSSAICTALSAAPLRRLSLEMNSTRPLPGRRRLVGADPADEARVRPGGVQRGRHVHQRDAGGAGQQLGGAARG